MPASVSRGLPYSPKEDEAHERLPLLRPTRAAEGLALLHRTFREPSANGYGETRDFRASDRLIPRFAPSGFALALNERELG